MEEIIARILLTKYPELASGWHLPIWGEVTDISCALDGSECTEEEPKYSVHVQILNPSGEHDKEIPVIEDVPLPVLAAGPQRGFWAKPSAGTRVEIAFAYGSPAHPFIRSILPHGLTLPSMAETDQRWQQSDKSYMQVDKEDKWQQKGKASLTEIEDDLKEQVGKLREIIAAKHHIGDASTNIFQLLHELMQTTQKLAQATAGHNHSYTWSDPGGAATTSPPIQTASINAASSEASKQAGKLKPLLK